MSKSYNIKKHKNNYYENMKKQTECLFPTPVGNNPHFFDVPYASLL